MTIRVMTQGDLDLTLQWAAAEGWNPGPDDAPAYLAADPQGFFVALRDGQPVAAISVVNHAPEFAFLGLYLCRPDWRGQGIAFDLWNHALVHAGGRTVGLDGVAAQEANYARSGFVRSGATLRMEGPLSGMPDTAIDRATEADLPALLALDHAANGYARPAFLNAWLRGTGTRITLALRQAQGIAGFATIRRCGRGAKIGPLVAADTATALRLIRAAVAALPTEVLIVDVPEDNAGLVRALSGAGFSVPFATARMYRGPVPRGNGQLQVPGTLELG